jgi:NADH-quinone oxidoreductase subunit L
MNWIIWLIPAFPLIGFLLNALVVRRERAAGILASVMVGLSFAATIAAMVVLEGAPSGAKRLTWTLWEWIGIADFRVAFGLLFDPLTAVMALLITGVGGLIHIYSIGYMHGDVRPVRFFAFMNLFVFAMLMLVMADNLLLLFLGWEGVGLCSFLLIGHYFDRRSVPPGINPSEAAVKAFVVNRVGDAAMLAALFAIFTNFGTLSFYDNPQLSISGYLDQAIVVAGETVDLGAFGQLPLMTGITLLMLVAVAGKSAQFPLYTWLPDAMAGPTPVSALIHAATMVTSGVYLIVRNHTLFDQPASAAPWVLVIGVMTAFIGATAAVAQLDVKRVLAYSTVSQLGYMVAAVGMGAYVAGMYHLLTHGLFKALLFLAAGSVIHGIGNHQDMRRMGGLRNALPTTFRLYVIGALALSGIFPLAGFWSKDEIIAHAWFDARSPLAAIMLILTSAVTAFYMGRQIGMVFFGRPRDPTIHGHESGAAMRWTMVALAGGAVVGGLINLPGLHWLNSYLRPVLQEPEVIYTVGMGILATITTLLSAGAGYLGWKTYARDLEPRIRIGKEDPMFRYLGDLWRGMEIGWGLDWLYQRVFVRPYRAASVFLSDVVDREAIDQVLVDGTVRGLARLAHRLRALQTGYIRTYALMFLFGVILVVAFFALRG